jgi:DNA polymerase I-like protein with 3'-5' exonuclease and polymerase domains
VDEVCRDWASETEVSIDLETSGLDPFRSCIAVVTLHAPGSDRTAILHVRGHLSERLRYFLSAPHVRWTHHNGTAFDLILLALAEVDIHAGRHYDTMVGELATLTSGRRDISVSLRATTQRRLRKTTKTDIDHGGWMNQELSREQLGYCLGDIGQLHLLRREQCERAAGTDVVREIEMEMELIPVTVAMSLNGLPIRRALYDQYTDRLHIRRNEAQVGLTAALGSINLRSPVQVKAALRKAGIAAVSTDKAHLRDLELRGCREASLLLQWRYADQRIKVYTEDWLAKHCLADDYGVLWVHSRFWQLGTDTGRFSGSDPNPQQFPRDMRFIFQGPPGRTMVSVDYSQLEVRWAAELGRDSRLIEALGSGGDAHRNIAGQVFNRPQAEVTPAQRKTAKGMVFCLLFAGGAETLYHYARNAGSDITRADADTLVRRFFQTYPGLGQMRDRANYLSRQRRPVTINLPSGLRRVLVAGQLRPTTILNTMIQGSAASGIKYAMLEVKREGLHLRGLGAQVHDELVACVPTAEHVEYGRRLRDCMIRGMERVMRICPVEAEIYHGSTWNDELLDAESWATAAASDGDLGEYDGGGVPPSEPESTFVYQQPH